MFCPVCGSLSFPRIGIEWKTFECVIVEKITSQALDDEIKQWRKNKPEKSQFEDDEEWGESYYWWVNSEPKKYRTVYEGEVFEKEGENYISCPNVVCGYHGIADYSGQLITVTESVEPRDMRAIPDVKTRLYSGINCPNCDGTDTYLDKEHNLYGADEDIISTIIHCDTCGTNFESIQNNIYFIPIYY